MRLKSFFILLLSLCLVMMPVMAQEDAVLTSSFNGFEISFPAQIAWGTHSYVTAGSPVGEEMPGGPLSAAVVVELAQVQYQVTSDYPAVPVAYFLEVDEFAQYGADNLLNLNLVRLQNLLAERPVMNESNVMIEPAMTDSPEIILPYLPVAAGGQLFNAKAHYVDTNYLRGVSYLTAFAFDVSPIVEGSVIYNFQGLSLDGRYYVAVSFPVKTGLLAETIPADLDWDAFNANYLNYLNETTVNLGAADPNGFTPSLSSLDQIIQSIKTPTEPVTNVENALAGTGWTLVSYGDAEVPIQLPVDVAAPYVLFNADLTLNGNDTCNNFFGTYVAEGDSVAVNEAIGMTRMACEEPFTTIAADFINLLVNASQFTFSDDMHMTISTRDGQVMNFIGSESLELGGGESENILADTSWILSSYGDVNALTELSTDVAMPQVVFHADLSLSGNDSCNDFLGQYKVNGNLIIVDEALGMTRMACAEPNQTIAADFAQLLTKASSFVYTDELHMTMTSVDGQVLNFVNSSALLDGTGSMEPTMENPLADSNWNLVLYGNPESPSEVPADVSVPTISFGADMSLNGNNGCNGFSGSYGIDADTLIIHDTLAMTLMACAEPVNTMANDFTMILMDANHYRFGDDGSLTIYANDGRQLIFARN